MSAEREAGLTALQNGNAAEAIPYLERAAGNAPNDLQTLLPLGAAYGQVGRHADAVRIVMQAVTLQPSNAAARYSLAVAYTNAGHQEYALAAAQQAVQLQPDYAQARELIARLSGGSTVSPTTLPGAQPALQTPAPSAYGEPTQALPSQPPTSTLYGQPASPSPYGQTQMPSTSGQPLPGQPTSRYGASGGAPYPPQAGAGSYQGQGAAAYGSSPIATYYTPPSRPGYTQPPDKFDMKQALTDWVRIIREPDAFFREQAERTGYNAPLGFLVTYGIGIAICIVVSAMIQLALHPSAALSIVFQILFGAVGAITGAIMGAFVWGGMLHLVGRMFGNRQPYERSFRVSAYSRAPLLIFTAITSLITPFLLPVTTFNPPPSSGSSPFGKVISVQYQAPTASGGGAYGSSEGTTQPRYGRSRATNPFDTPEIQKVIQTYEVVGPISFLGMIWVWCLQAMGLKHAQRISGGAAGGTVFVALLIPFLIIGGICLLGYLGIRSLMSASPGPSGFQHLLSCVPSGLAVWRGL